ncbi:MAG: cell division protein FtsX [Pseudolabrys sp.]
MTDRGAPIHAPNTSAPPRHTAPPRGLSPIVPRQSISGRALLAVVAIMTFLAALTAGSVMLVRTAASAWESDVAREVTIQVRPAPDRDLDAATLKASEIARNCPGIASVRPYTREESARLLEPWLGSGLSLDDLPVPRMIVVTLAPSATVDLPQLRKRLADQVTGATLDDHRGWIERMRSMSTTAVVIGVAILLLMLAATMLSVMFATRGAMAANRPVIEVLHFIGARDDYIATHFQRHFLLLGLQGGAIGGGIAIVLFALAGLISSFMTGSAAGDQTAALFGSFSIGLPGYVAILAQIVLMAGVTALASRHTVARTLDAID